MFKMGRMLLWLAVLLSFRMLRTACNDDWDKQLRTVEDSTRDLHIYNVILLTLRYAPPSVQSHISQRLELYIPPQEARSLAAATGSMQAS